MSNDLAEQRFKDRVRSFIFDVIKNPEDVIVSDHHIPRSLTHLFIVARGTIATYAV